MTSGVAEMDLSHENSDLSSLEHQIDTQQEQLNRMLDEVLKMRVEAAKRMMELTTLTITPNQHLKNDAATKEIDETKAELKRAKATVAEASKL